MVDEIEFYSYVGNVKAMARRVWRKLKVAGKGEMMEYGDIEQSGYVGLLDAMRRRDRVNGWGRYLEIKIRGAIIDGIRKGRGRVGSVGRRKLELDIVEARGLDRVGGVDVGIDVHKELGEVMKRMSPRKAAIVELYFLKGKSIREIGEEFGVSESRMSQLFSEVKKALRDRIGEM